MNYVKNISHLPLAIIKLNAGSAKCREKGHIGIDKRKSACQKWMGTGREELKWCDFCQGNIKLNATCLHL